MAFLSGASEIVPGPQRGAAKTAGVRIGLGSDSFCSEITPYGEQSLNELKALVKKYRRADDHDLFDIILISMM